MKHMIVMLLAILNINATMNSNRVIFYFKRIPLIGRLMPDRIYGDLDLKMMVTIVVTIFNGIKKLFIKALYVGLMIVLPLLYFYEYKIETIPPETFINLFFFLSFIGGTVQISALLESNRNKYICIKLMKFGARDFVVPTMLARHTSNFIYFLPVILIPYILFGGSVWKGILLLILLTAVRFTYEACQLFIYEKTGILLIKRYIVQWALILSAVIAAYLPIYFSTIWPIQNVLFSVPMMMTIFICFGFSIVYIFKFENFRKVVYSSIKLDAIMLDFSKAMGEARFNGVRMKEDDFTAEILESRKFENMKGYDYLNAIFFERHKKLLEKPIKIRLYIIGAAFVILSVIGIVSPGLDKELDKGILGVLPAFVFIMYFASIGDQVCKAMFYNCDISLLRYGFYRDKAVILKNFKVRLLKLTGLNLVIGGAMSIAFLSFLAIAGVNFTLLDLIYFVASILCLSVFFSVHHLFLYYVFQPYTTELGMKNPFFKIINVVVYLICYGCLQIRNAPGFFTLALIGATAVYIILGLTLVYKLAPGRFRVK